MKAYLAGSYNTPSEPQRYEVVYTAGGLDAYTAYRLRVRARSAELGWGAWRYSTSTLSRQRTLGYPGVPGTPALRARSDNRLMFTAEPFACVMVRPSAILDSFPIIPQMVTRRRPSSAAWFRA